MLGQSFGDFELFVMDDHSPTALNVPGDPRITLIRSQENVGKSVQINRALERAPGEVVAFLDDDDAWCPHRLAHAHAAHQLGPIAVCRQGDMGRDGCSESLQAPMKVGTKRALTRREIPGHMNSVSVDRGVCPPFDGRFRACEDLEWGVRLQSRSDKLVSINSTDSMWRTHGGPRHLNGHQERIRASRDLLRLHGAHYKSHPRQRAVRLYRIGHMLLNEDQASSLRYAVRSLRVRTTRLALTLLGRNIIRLLTRQHPGMNVWLETQGIERQGHDA